MSRAEMLKAHPKPTARGGGSPVQLVYDGDGNLVRKTVGSVTTYYLIDDLNPTGLPQVLEESESVSGGARTLKKAFVYGHDLISQKQVVSSATHYYGYDGHGNVRFLTDTNGSVTDTYTFDAFGNLLASTGSTPSEYLHSGERWDPNLQFYYLRARFLNPQTGRFWTMDSFEGVLSEPGTLHKYLYTENNPVNLIDPTGNFSFAELLSVQAIDKIVKGIQGIASNVAIRKASLSLLQSQVMKRLSTKALSKAGNAVAKKIAQGWLKKYVKRFASNMKRISVLKVDTTIPDIRNHIADNITQKKYTVLSSYLGRDGAILRVLNRRAALANPKWPDRRTTPPRKAGESYDEFPLASSLQGAALFPDWSSVGPFLQFKTAGRAAYSMTIIAGTDTSPGSRRLSSQWAMARIRPN